MTDTKMSNGSFGKTYATNRMPFDPGKRCKPRPNLDQLDMELDHEDDIFEFEFVEDEDVWE